MNNYDKHAQTQTQFMAAFLIVVVVVIDV